MKEPSRSLRGRTAALVLLTAGLAAPLAAATGDDRFAEAKTAFESASGSPDTRHAGYVKAYVIWTELADAGDTRALYHLGIMHMHGLGGAEFDQYIAVRDIRASAEAGYPVAQSFMGFMVENSDGTLVKTGDALALEWWRKGAEGNHCVAVRRMARAYANGELGLAADPAQAAAWRGKEESCDKN